MTKSQITPFPLRLAPDLREKLDAAARASGRSLQSEIAVRLERTLEQDEGPRGDGVCDALAPVPLDIAKLAKLLAEHLKKDATADAAPSTPAPRRRRAPAKLK